MSTMTFFFLLFKFFYWPLIVCLGALSCWTLLELGGFVFEALERRAKQRRWKAFYHGVMALTGEDYGELLEDFFRQGSGYPGFLGVFARRAAGQVKHRIRLEKIISDLELDSLRVARRMNLGIRLGPALGLIGTLLPLGPAIMALSSGRGGIQAGAADLALAFATTVVGLLCGMSCYVMYWCRSHWYAQDLANVEFVFALLPESGETSASGEVRP